ncbi:MAG: LamG domain-containing protein, partial [Verrucomicrobiia bacterium]
PGESFTLALWARSDGGAGAWHSPVTSRNDKNPDSQGYIIYDNQPNGAWTFWSGNGTVDGNWQTLDGPAVNVGDWDHLAITYDDVAEVKKLYVNGELAVESNDAVAENDTKPLNIGAGGDIGTAYFFKGDIDDIGLWNKALSQEEIQGVMNYGVVPGDAPAPASEILIDFGGTAPNSAGASPEPWVTLDNLVMDEAVDLGGGVTITALDDGFNPNNPAQPGEGAEYDGVSVPQEARNEYFFKITDTAGTTARMRIDGLAAGTYNVTVFEGRTTDASQFAKIWTGEEPAAENTGNFAQGSATVTVTVSAGEPLWYMHLEDNTGGVSGMMIREAADTPALSIVNNGDGSVTVTFEGKLQGAASVNGPWADVEGAVSPQIIPASEAMQYGRAVK